MCRDAIALGAARLMGISAAHQSLAIQVLEHLADGEMISVKARQQIVQLALSSSCSTVVHMFVNQVTAAPRLDAMHLLEMCSRAGSLATRG